MRTLRNTRFSLAALAALAAVALIGGAARPAAAQTYTVKNLGVLPGLTHSSAWAVNERGQVVGKSWKDATRTTPRIQHAFLWTPGGTAGSASNPQMQDLGGLDGKNEVGLGVNNAGQVIGSDNVLSLPFLWDAVNGLRNMNDPSVSDAASRGWTLIETWKINDAGQVIGRYRTSSGQTRQYLWNPVTPNAAYGTLSDPGQPDGFDTGAHNALNNLGQTTGWMTPTGGGTRHLFLWNPTDPATGTFSANAATGAYTDLGTAGVLNATNIVGKGINDAAQITGFVVTAGSSYGFVQDASGATALLPLNSNPNAINNAAQIVGSYSSRAFLWDMNNGMRDLNTLMVAGDTAGMTLKNALDINNATVNGLNKGQIVGEAYVNKQGTRAFLLTPQ